MTPKQIRLVQESWAGIAPIQAQATALFYDRLFLVDPTLRSLFKDDMEEQRNKLTVMLGVVVNGLTRLDALASIVRNLGSRHARYGVRDKHYVTVGAALLWTLEKGLGPAFTPEVKEAWTVAYGLLSATMQQGAAAAAA